MTSSERFFELPAPTPFFPFEEHASLCKQKLKMNAEALANAKHGLKHAEAVHPEKSAVPQLAPLCPDGETFLKKMKETFLETYYDGKRIFRFRWKNLFITWLP